MPASRAPWWLYLIAASFLAYFTFSIYTSIRGGMIGFRHDYNNGLMRVLKVTPDGAGARAGLRGR
jgi:hypothetical protein